MEDNPRYITQLTSDWIKRVSKAANLKAGNGIKLTPDGDGVKVEIDQETFKQWIWTWIKRGTTTAVNTITLSDIGSVSLDPGA